MPSKTKAEPFLKKKTSKTSPEKIKKIFLKPDILGLKLISNRISKELKVNFSAK